MQTIQEQQKVIRRLLKKTNSSDSLKQPSVNSEDNNDLTGGQKIVLDYDNDNIDDNERTTTILSQFEKGWERLLQLDP